MKKALLQGLLILGLSACASYGERLDDSKVRAFKPGVTTLKQAKASLGEPAQVVYGVDGSIYVSWTYLQGNLLVGTNNQRVSIQFDAQEKMLRVVDREEF